MSFDEHTADNRDDRAVQRLAALPEGPHPADACWRCGGEPDAPAPRSRPWPRPICARCLWGTIVRSSRRIDAEDGAA